MCELNKKTPTQHSSSINKNNENIGEENHRDEKDALIKNYEKEPKKHLIYVYFRMKIDSKKVTCFLRDNDEIENQHFFSLESMNSFTSVKNLKIMEIVFENYTSYYEVSPGKI